MYPRLILSKKEAIENEKGTVEDEEREMCPLSLSLLLFYRIVVSSESFVPTLIQPPFFKPTCNLFLFC